VYATTSPEDGSPPADIKLDLGTHVPIKKPLSAALICGSGKHLAITRLGLSHKKRLDLTKYRENRQYYKSQANGLIFSPEGYLHELPEVQACRLISYLCSFDPRVKPLLTVIRYWAKVNDIRLAKPSSGRHHPPDPAALDWLVIFFLCYKKKMVPTPRQVVDQPHAKLMLENFDIGFSTGSKFAQEFSQYEEEEGEDVRVFNIFSLAKQLFKFYSHELGLGEKKLVLNMKDGEIIPMEAFHGKVSSIPTNLTQIEIEMTRKGNVTTNNAVLSLLHPLYLRQGFSFCDKTFVSLVCPKMAITRKKMEKVLTKYKKGDMQNGDIMSALNVNLT